jgi:hypothetical protein
MNSDNQHIDGDDYTWQAGPVQAGAVFIPDAQPGTADAWAERWQQRRGGPDLRTADQVERDDTAQLALRCDNLVDALAAMGGRVAALERTVAALVKVLEVRL